MSGGTGAAVAEDGSSLSVEITGGNRRGREAAEGRHLPMVFPVKEGTEVDVNDGEAALSGVQIGDGVQVQARGPSGATELPLVKSPWRTSPRSIALSRPHPKPSLRAS